MLVEQIIFPAELSFATLHRVLSNYFALVYLQDQQSSFFACLPKALQQLDKKCLWQRQADFSYQCQNLSAPILPKLKARPQTDRQAVHFRGGYVAFISYDYAAAQQIPLRQAYATRSAIIAEYDLIIQQQHGRWCLYTAEDIANAPMVLSLIAALLDPDADAQPPATAQLRLQHPMQACWSKAQYQAAFEAVQQYLHAGDCYQINLTQAFASQIQSGSLGSVLPQLLHLSQAPYAAYLRFADFELLSCSPELFIQFESNGQLLTQPIKGTMPRHQDPHLDQASKQQLLDSSKDQAENLMIVDLLRNDLSLYAETGSVEVPSLFSIHSFAQVHHMVSEIRAQLKPDADPWQVLFAALPGGSITGAPKIRAMQIINQLEVGNRGAYCGSMGYFNYDGSGRFNILIRSLQRYQQNLSVWAGGGITVASELDAEYQECLDKIGALLAFLNQYQ